MNKTEIISSVCEKTNIERKAATELVNAVFDTIQEAMAQGETVRITGFGNFAVKDQQGRKGKNPKTGAEIDIPPRRKASFRAGKDLVNALER